MTVTLPPGPTDPVAPDDAGRGTSRRRFLGFLVAGPTLVAASQIAVETAAPTPAAANVPTGPEPGDLYDLGQLQVLATKATSNLITVEVHKDNTVSFALPRAEVGQGITTTMAMLIADEMDISIDRVHVTLSKARPEYQFNQLTGGSNSVRSLYAPVRHAAAIARKRMVDTAAARWRVDASTLTVTDGVIRARDGRSATYGSLTKAAATSRPLPMTAELKPTDHLKLVGKSHNRIDAHEIVTGRKKFAMDHVVPDALPTMVCRPPTIKGTVKRVHNRAAVLKMPGITDVVTISTGVAVRGRTFGQCIDAVRALKVSWADGPVGRKSDADILAELHKNEVPLAVPDVSPLAKTIDLSFTFAFASNSPLETGTAIADVRAKSAEVWSCLKAPIVAQQRIAEKVGLPMDAVTVHVVQGGGSFGRHLFHDTALEAAEISKKLRKPVKLMWHRTDDFRQGRVHPMATSRIRATVQGDNVFTYEQRHTSVSTDFDHGFGDLVSSFAGTLPGFNFLGLAQTVFELSQNMPYEYGMTDQVLDEVDMDFVTGSMRNIYSPDVTTARELMTDRLAKEMGLDPHKFRRKFLKDDRAIAVLDKVAKVGNWGRKMPHGTAQGIALHAEYKGFCATLVEIDCRTHTVKRKIRDAFTGPRVTKAVTVVDVGLPINPRGLEAQMMGGMMDGIALALTSSLHLRDGHFLEGSWDNYWYTRQWNVPPTLKVIVMPQTSNQPGGAGELGVAAAKAAVACAYTRATGKMPTKFPINHDEPLGFQPLPTTPSIPQSPTDGLRYAY
ncbi:MAG TPA: molybdopterin cofactor-binding domain-containing protein [Mycobacteriales bacterium]|nr:molybdopterin cofactor-binding domain-containing protein [Mycobacteriales bacterium]